MSNIKDNANIIRMPDFSTNPEPNGVGHLYYYTMLKNQHKIAQIDGITSKQESFGSLLQRCVRTAITLKSKGIKPGDFISSCTSNHLDTCVPYIASLFTGAVMTAVDPSLTEQEIVYLLKQVSPKMIFVSEKSVGLIEKVNQQLETKMSLVVFGTTTEHVPFSDFLNEVSNEDKYVPRSVKNLEETAVVIFTSGTTGKPKGVCHTHRSILSNPKYPSECTYSILASFFPIYWSVFHRFVHTGIINGAAVLVFNDFDFNDPWKIFNFKIDYTVLGPPHCIAFLRHKKPDHVQLHNLKTLVISGNKISLDQMLQVKACLFETDVCARYGQTEVFNNIFSFSNNCYEQELAKKYPDSVGLPMRGFCYKVVDFETNEIVGPNTKGELRLKSVAQTKGYYNQDSSELFDEDGWLKTGDLVYYNEEKCFFIVDRIKESFKYLHHHICPSEIEKVLLSHPLIKNAVVLGVPHPTDNKHPMAVVELSVKNSQITSSEIEKYVNERVEDKERLRGGVKILANIPLTVSTKVNRFKLAQMLINNKI